MSRLDDDFWSTSDGSDLRESAEKSYDSGGGFITIPDNTNCLAVIDAAEWKQDAHLNEFINLRWDVTSPDAYAGAKIQQKLWVKDMDPKAKDGKAKRDKARRMFAAIDANAGGKLAKAGREPEADGMALALFNKQMGIKVRTWELDGEDGKPITGNWICAVMPRAETAISEPAKAPPRKAAPVKEELDDDIPF